MFERIRRTTATNVSVLPVRDTGLEVLAFLAEQGLDSTPLNYELGYHYRMHRDGLAARAVDAITMSGDRLSQAQVGEIVQTHLRSVMTEGGDEQSRVRHQTVQLADLAAAAVETTGQFGRDLAGGLDDLTAKGIDLATVVGAMIERSRTAEQALAQSAQQIETLRQEVEAARGDAARDALTGLHNRRGIEAEVRELKGRKQSVVAICDVDHFKSINDRYGHSVGDRVLKLVASSIAESCDPHLVARWGGEEFIILMNGVDLVQATAMVDQARATLRGRNLRVRETAELLGTITFSAGVAPLGGRKFDEAVQEADGLLYQAKANGRDQVVAVG